MQRSPGTRRDRRSGKRVPTEAAHATVTTRRAALGFLLIAIVWGGTFPVVKDLVEMVSPYSLVAARFGIAWLLLGLVALPRRRLWRPRLLASGALLGAVLWGGYFTQTFGLQFTTASKAGFITALNVVFVAVMAAVLSRRRTPMLTWLGVAVATVGLAMLTIDGTEGFHLQPGDAFVLLCAVLFAAHIVLVDRLAPTFDPVLLTWVQLGVVAVVAAMTALVFDGGIVGFGRPESMWPLLFLAVMATAGAVLMQVYLQKFTAPARVGLILSLEPVFAALFAWLLLGETLPLSGWIGGALVLAGVVLAELKPEIKPMPGAEARSHFSAGDAPVRGSERRSAPSLSSAEPMGPSGAPAGRRSSTKIRD